MKGYTGFSSGESSNLENLDSDNAFAIALMPGRKDGYGQGFPNAIVLNKNIPSPLEGKGYLGELYRILATGAGYTDVLWRDSRLSWQ